MAKLRRNRMGRIVAIGGGDWGQNDKGEIKEFW